MSENTECPAGSKGLKGRGPGVGQTRGEPKVSHCPARCAGRFLVSNLFPHHVNGCNNASSYLLGKLN